jgi:hypothetical protein
MGICPIDLSIFLLLCIQDFCTAKVACAPGKLVKFHPGIG